jgi:Ca-activated chloride channel family protein
MKINIKQEFDAVKANTKTSLGLMVEVEAPATAKTEIVSRTNSAFVFVVDTSGSMGGGRLELVKDSLLAIWAELRPEDYFGVVKFEDTADIVIGLKRKSELNAGNVRTAISNLQPGGSTSIEAGLRLGLAEAASSPDSMEATVILLSDGQANHGEVRAEVLGQLAAQATEHLITVSTFGIGQNYDEKILDQLSISGNGNHFAGLTLEELHTGLRNEVEDLLSKTVKDLSIEFKGAGDAPTNLKVNAIQRLRKFTRRNGGGTADVGDLSEEEIRSLLFEIELPTGVDANYPGVLVQLKISWTDLNTGEKKSHDGEVYIKSFDQDDFIEPAKDEDILAEMAIYRAGLIHEEIIRLFDMGMEEEARLLARNSGADFGNLLHRLSGTSLRQSARLGEQVNAFMFMENESAVSNTKRSRENMNRIFRAKKSSAEARKPLDDEI